MLVTKGKIEVLRMKSYLILSFPSHVKLLKLYGFYSTGCFLCPLIHALSEKLRNEATILPGLVSCQRSMEQA